MKALLMTLAIVGVLFFLGWLSFTSINGSASVTLDSGKVKADTSTAVEKGKELVEEGIEKLKSAGDKAKVAVDPEPEPREPTSSAEVQP
ncbi:MAG: hypothetical protein H7Z17_01690 [Fuerstia sp.]|nr:hypothetical protein [Fuerstiella sp.]